MRRSTSILFVMLALGTPRAAAAAPEEPPASPNVAPPEEDALLRVGVSLAGGMLLEPGRRVLGCGQVGIQGRVGARLGPSFGMLYVNTLEVWLAPAPAALFDWNIVLATFTIREIVDLGLGPSMDFLISGDGGRPAMGGHERFALLLGKPRGTGPRRSGFTLGVDAHQSFAWSAPRTERLMISVLAQFGYEWY